MRNQENAPELTADEIAKLRAAIQKEVRDNPPTIGLVGVSGVGKSSTINALFKTSLPTSETVPCTKKFTTKDISLKLLRGEQKGLSVSLRIIDAPGLGGDIKMDSGYISMYKKYLPQCDVILWVLMARHRGIALDQFYLTKLKKFHKKMVFGLNQVDLVEPLDWNNKINLPSEKQLKNIAIIIKDRAEKLRSIVKRKVRIIPYSATRKYNLGELFKFILEACPPTRSWIFDSLKNFHYADFLPTELKKSFVKGDDV